MYEKFSKLDGTHPWRGVSPEGFVDYPVRYRKGGRVLFFNFFLAKEIGLIPPQHPNRMNPKLEEIILQTFSLRILNEHDWINKKRWPQDHFKDNLFMATRYLQSQHENKRGLTSGDGRSIWNGILQNRSTKFDVSSRGTGSTILSPGAQEAQNFIQTGSGQYGYSTGLADADEMLSSAIMSEIFFREGIPTERCLLVIDYKDGNSIGVRTAPNLIRPAHIFRYLKLEMKEDLRKSFDYFLRRQIENKVWKLPHARKARYQKALKYLTKTYAKIAAVLEEEYIFNWLAWDGDNILASGGVLDYGSIRQFAAKHDKYRYEDVDRFSSSLTEQRTEAKRLIQTFIQAVDFILGGEKCNIDHFKSHRLLKEFDRCFVMERQKRMLWRVGFESTQIQQLIRAHSSIVADFQKVLDYFELIKTNDGISRVPDGIDHPPVFLVRHILRILPLYILKRYNKKQWPMMPPEDFCRIMLASYVDQDDLALTETRRQKSIEFQESYQRLLKAAGIRTMTKVQHLVDRSAVINYAYRRTGDGLTWIVKSAIKLRYQMNRDELQEAIERFIQSQVLIPGKWKPIQPHELEGNSLKVRLLRTIQEKLEIYHDTI
jgi:hypothetical protein